MINFNPQNLTPNREVDYLFMKFLLKDYAQPRAKITALLRSKELIRVKKGLYVLDGHNKHQPIVKETLANLIYGPSYISLEYALAFYGFIPERVQTLTNVTSKKDKLFKTPIGVFSYRYLNPIKYSVGLTQIKYDATHFILIATPEKALADLIALASPNLHLKSINDLTDFLFADLRISLDKVASLNNKLFNKIANIYNNKNVTFLNQSLKILRKENA